MISEAKYIKTLLKLKEMGELNYSSLPKILLANLLEESLVEVKTITGRKKRVIAKGVFYEVYSHLEGISSATMRSELISEKSHSKSKKISPQRGLYLNGNCEILGVKLPLFDKSAILLREIPPIHEAILVVVVENFENLIFWENQLELFPKGDILFLFRNKISLELIKNIKNKIIYFGDFDLAGVDIFQTQIKTRNKNIQLFIPQGVEGLIEKFGSRELFSKQIDRYKNIKSDDEAIQKLISTIIKYQKGLEQEFFIGRGI
jgi:hypothetical protein